MRCDMCLYRNQNLHDLKYEAEKDRQSLVGGKEGKGCTGRWRGWQKAALSRCQRRCLHSVTPASWPRPFSSPFTKELTLCYVWAMWAQITLVLLISKLCSQPPAMETTMYRLRISRTTFLLSVGQLVLEQTNDISKSSSLFVPVSLRKIGVWKSAPLKIHVSQIYAPKENGNPNLALFTFTVT